MGRDARSHFRNSRAFASLFTAVAALSLTAGGARAQRCAAPLPPSMGVPPVSSNPVLVRVLGGPIIPVPATDGLVHLAYSAQVTNLEAGTARIRSIVPVDPRRNFKRTGDNAVANVNDAPITGEVRVFGRPGGNVDTPMLAAGASGVTFFDVTYPGLSVVPELISHLVSVGLPGDRGLATLTDPVSVSCDAPVRLSPPLTGHGWWNGNGCCRTVNAHRSATLPLNGDLRPPEQFAIDFVQINAAGGCCTGEVRDLRSWPFYGAPVLASAAGTVVVAVDGMPDQVPGPPQGVTIETAPGNHVIQDIGGGRWVLYAHLRPGTVAVRPGQVLQAGERLGELGNSGSTTAPHLHFQVMDRPSALNAVGLPFVFDNQRLEGIVLGSPAQAELDYEAGRTLRVDRRGGAARQNEMTAEGHVVGFHLD